MNTESGFQGKLLIIDDEAIAVENLAHAFRKLNYDVTTRTTGPGGIEALQKEHFDVILTDLRMERADGMAVLRHALEKDPDTAVIMITGYATIDSAVEATKAGAYYYIAKPFRLEEVRTVVAHAMERVQLKRENDELRSLVENQQSGTRIITQDAAMRRILDVAKQVAIADCNVLIIGESGTGKELIARHIHQHSNRNKGPFVAVNCGALQEDLLANELFGHEKGAFTGAVEAHKGLIESAENGSIFLDEIAEMSLAMQVKLLRVIQEREVQRLGSTHAIPVNVRFIAATNRDLKDSVATGRFRQDLYFRLDVVTLQIPTLSERRDDIPLLAYFFLKKYSRRNNRPVEDIAPETMEILCDYDYPGNIRELENLIERGVALADTKLMLPRHLPPSLTERTIQVVRNKGQRLPTLEQQQNQYIQWVLDQTGGNRTKAAEILGIGRASLWRKLKQ